MHGPDLGSDELRVNDMAGSDFSKETSARQMLNHFEGPSEENDTWWARKNAGEQERFNKFLEVANAAYTYAKLNGIPDSYKDHAKFYTQMLKRENAPINAEDLYALDTAVGRTMFWADVTAKLPITTITTPKGARWEMKDYLVTSIETPAATKTFRSPKYISISPTSQFTNMTGLILGWSIPFTEIAESRGGLWSPQAIMMEECATKMGLQRGRTRLLGTACNGMQADDGSDGSTLGITGLFNYSSRQTFEAGDGGDDNMGTAGDSYANIVKQILPDFKKVYQPGPIVLLSSAGISGEAWLHRDTYQNKTDIAPLKEICGPGKKIQGWWNTDELYKGTIDNTHQQMCAIKCSPALVNFVDCYPMQTLPIASKLYEGDVVEVMIWGGGVQFKKRDTTTNAVPITVAVDVSTTGTGFHSEADDVLADILSYPNFVNL